MAEEIERLARAGTTISHCPCSNQVLASGFCPVCDLERAGVRVGIGVDGSASNDGSNLIQEVRTAFLIQRSRYGVSAVSHRDALRWATKGSAACIGRPELGEIRAGKIADLALFKLDERKGEVQLQSADDVFFFCRGEDRERPEANDGRDCQAARHRQWQARSEGL